MLTELIEEIDNIESETEGVIKLELKKVFGKHIEEIVQDLLNENMESVKKALDIGDEHGEEELAPIKEILRTLRSYQRRGKEEKGAELGAIAISILQVCSIPTKFPI